MQKFKSEKVSTLEGPFSAVSPNLPIYRFIPSRSRRDLGVSEERNPQFIEKTKKKSGRKSRFFRDARSRLYEQLRQFGKNEALAGALLPRFHAAASSGTTFWSDIAAAAAAAAAE